MTTTNNQSTTAIVGLLIGCILFGLGSVLVVHVSLGAYAMAFWRLLVSLGVFLLLSLAFGQRFPRSRPAVLFAILSGMALGVDLGLWHESIYAVGPGISTLLNSLQIFFLALIGFVFFKEKQSKRQLTSLIIAIIGVALIASPEFAHNTGALWGFVSGILSGACLAVSMTWVRHVQKFEDVAIFPLMSLVGLGGTLALLPLMLMFDAGNTMPITLSQMGWILVYGVVMQCMAWGVIAYSIPRLSLTLTGLLLLSEPVAALMIDYVWLNKAINITQWLGASLTLFAIYLGSSKDK